MQCPPFEERIGLARENVKIQGYTLRIAEVRFRNGVVSELDTLQARALLRDTEALVFTLETGARQTLHAISVLLGRPPSELRDILDDHGKIPSAVPEIAVGAPINLLRRRPDVRVAELRAAAQSARIGIAQSDLFPRFTLLGSIGLTTSDNGGLASNNAVAGNLFDASSLTYLVGASFSWPILNYGRLKNRVRIEDARFQQAALNYQNTVLNAAREVEDALAAYLRAQVRVELLADSVVAAKSSVELSLIEYRSGIVNYQRVLDTQRFLVQQQDQLTQSRGDVALSLIAAYKALGGGWQISESPAPLPEAIEKEMSDRTDWGSLLPVRMPTEKSEISE